jgi:hypothetical protein
MVNLIAAALKQTHSKTNGYCYLNHFRFLFNIILIILLITQRSVTIKLLNIGSVHQNLSIKVISLTNIRSKTYKNPEIDAPINTANLCFSVELLRLLSHDSTR